VYLPNVSLMVRRIEGSTGIPACVRFLLGFRLVFVSYTSR
jgi:hypothetical protein